MIKHIEKFFLLLLASLFCTACSYRLAGTDQPLPFRNLALKQVENNAYVAQATNPLTFQVSNRLLQNPSVNLTDLESADAVLEITIEDYTKRDYARSSIDTALASGNRVTMRVFCSLKDKTSNKYYFKDKEIEATNHIYTKDGLINAEYNNMTVLTDELAKRIVDQVLGVW